MFQHVSRTQGEPAPGARGFSRYRVVEAFFEKMSESDDRQIGKRPTYFATEVETRLERREAGG
jgi:hypothetical protein